VQEIEGITGARKLEPDVLPGVVSSTFFMTTPVPDNTDTGYENLVHDLGERVKELTALHGTARILGTQGTVEDWLREFVDLLPPAWQYPDVTAARVRVGGLECATSNFTETNWTQRVEFSTADGPGLIEVVYLEERPRETEGPFLAEERNLIESLAGMLREAIDRQNAELALHQEQAALRASYSRIEDLAGRLITAQEAERSRIARELHDDTSQQLAALSMGLSSLRSKLPEGAPDIRDELTRLQHRATALAESLRQLSHRLHPSLLQHCGLAEALKSECAEFSRLHNVETIFSADDIPAVGDDVALCLYRVVQEALRNIARHAGAQRVRISMTRTASSLQLTIANDGRGFELDEAHRQKGLGLISVEERVHLVHGTVIVDSRLREGTAIRAQVPLPNR
jgi:signal transduction histidine kinase